MLEQFPWIPFVVAITTLTVVPGTDTLMVLRRSVTGWKPGLLASVGICMGLFVHGALSALGVSALLASSPALFSVLKGVGAGYLIYLGALALRDALKGRDLLPSTLSTTDQRSAFYQGFINNLLNPKTLLFYIALLPQFLIMGYSPVLQSLMMAAVHFLIAMVWQSALVLLVQQARAWLCRGPVIRSLDALSGTVFVLFGLRLVLDKSLY